MTPAPRLQLAATFTGAAPPTRRLLTDARREVLKTKAVDRSQVGRWPLPRWSPAGERGDQRVTIGHEETTVAEVMHAWRCFFTNTDRHGRPLRRSGYLWWERSW